MTKSGCEPSWKQEAKCNNALHLIDVALYNLLLLTASLAAANVVSDKSSKCCHRHRSDRDCRRD